MDGRDEPGDDENNEEIFIGWKEPENHWMILQSGSEMALPDLFLAFAVALAQQILGEIGERGTR